MVRSCNLQTVLSELQEFQLSVGWSKKQVSATVFELVTFWILISHSIRV